MTGNELLKKLPCAARRKAKANIFAYRRDAYFMLTCEYESLWSLIYSGFVLMRTVQGVDYWTEKLEKYN